MTAGQRIERLIAEMTLAEKVGQMTQVEKYSITPDDVAEHGIGSIISGAGGNPVPNTAETWSEMVTSFEEAALRSRLGVPLLYGVDAVHGHTNVSGATIFPHNIGLGASRDADLVTRIARVTAEELVATGVRWDFAPPVSVPRDIRWGRVLEAYSEDPALVAELGVAFLRGLQDAGEGGLAHPRAVLGCVKHFAADGATAWGSAGASTMGSAALAEGEEALRNEFGPLYDHGVWGQRIDQGVAYIGEEELRDIHLAPYVAALANGARNVMVSLSSWNDVKLHGHYHLLTEVLKGELGFDGFLVSDWLGLDYLDDDYYTATVIGINAGIDMVMVPHEWERFMAALIAAVEAGDVTMDRIDDAVRRILTVKAELGLFDGVTADRSRLSTVGSEEHRALAREAVAKSLVVLKNEGALPLDRDADLVFVAGTAADDMGLQCGGWTVEWRGMPGARFPGASLLDAVRSAVSPGTEVVYDPEGDFGDRIARTAIVAIAEPPYAEMTGDRADLSLSPEDVALIERVRARCDTLVFILYSGRPLLVTDVLGACDGFVAAWLPGSEGEGITDVLFGDVPPTGRLPVSWPRDASQIPLEALYESSTAALWALGFGLDLGPVNETVSPAPAAAAPSEGDTP